MSSSSCIEENAMIKSIIRIHTKCRNTVYPSSNINRFTVPDDLVDWKIEYPSYEPAFYESSVLNGKNWADPKFDDPKFQPIWNERDDNVNRISYTGTYNISNNKPLNPNGRTGIGGRGLLGRWGPNHAADPIVTRWKRGSDGKKVISVVTKKAILQMCGIERIDCKEWAIPGGMVDPGENISATLRREFMEEAMSSSELSEAISDFFKSGKEIYRGYVDDRRNTDNAWMETVAVNFHDHRGDRVGQFDLDAGSDAAKVRWIDIDGSIKLYASHLEMVKEVVKLLNAHW